MVGLFGSKGFEACSPSGSDEPLRFLRFGQPQVANLPASDADQFTIVSLSDEQDGARLQDPHSATPSLSGSDQNPDAQLRVELAAFHLGDADGLDQHATLRIDVGQTNPGGGYSDLVFWSAATALDLVTGNGARAKPRDVRSNIQAAFGPRPIDLPAAMGSLRFEVVAHAEPPWWRRVFNLVRSESGQALSATLGFPGVVQQAVELVDEFLNRLEEVENKPLIQSAPLEMAITDRARDEYTGGNKNVLVAVLNPGFHVLVRNRDLSLLQDARTIYVAGHGLLVPEEDVAKAGRSGYGDAFRNVPYAVLRLRAAEARLDSAV